MFPFSRSPTPAACPSPPECGELESNKSGIGVHSPRHPSPCFTTAPWFHSLSPREQPTRGLARFRDWKGIASRYELSRHYVAIGVAIRGSVAVNRAYRDIASRLSSQSWLDNLVFGRRPSSAAMQQAQFDEMRQMPLRGARSHSHVLGIFALRRADPPCEQGPAKAFWPGQASFVDDRFREASAHFTTVWRNSRREPQTPGARRH